jgi:hypothetical protein
MMLLYVSQEMRGCNRDAGHALLHVPHSLLKCRGCDVAIVTEEVGQDRRWRAFDLLAWQA